MNQIKIIISGIVQGVGFRPFLFNFLKSKNFTGSIKNTGNLGVSTILQTFADNFDPNSFIEELKFKIPQIAYIEEIKICSPDREEILSTDFSQLQIIPSNEGTGKGLTLPPDIAMCEKCVKEFQDKSQSRFYQYPFLACAQCGPRFTIMKTLPYDRPNSTMDSFKFCKGSSSCDQDYHDIQDRRFHAQTFSCHKCGPYYSIQYPNTQIIQNTKPSEISPIIEALRKGQIVAIKGIGGVNLVCRADVEESIQIMRSRKKDRKYKPFALMMPDIQTIKKYCDLPDSFIPVLCSFRRPIVLLPKKNNLLSDLIAPGLPNVGVLLPYMGLHYQLFDGLGKIPLIFTSGNESTLPISISNEEIIKNLSDMADIFYLHNRDIYQRCDDSVLRPVNQIPTLIRRSRGYVPEYIKLPFNSPFQAIIGVGAELNSTGAVTRGDRIFPTQHIGNVRNLETYEFLENALSHLQTLLKIQSQEIGAIARDLHPAFLSTRLSQEIQQKLVQKQMSESKRQGIQRENNQYAPPITQVQHHHAHLASLLVDHNLSIEDQITAITIDGVGYGLDGQPWGGEILSGSYRNFSRQNHLHTTPMVGGDLCAKNPSRMLLCHLLNNSNIQKEDPLILKIVNELDLSKNFPQKKLELDFLLTQFDYSKQNSLNKYPQTSSFGRWLDSVAALFNVCQERTYRGEPAMRLEGFIWNSTEEKILDIDDYYSDNEIFASKLLLDYAEQLFDSNNGSLKRKRILARSLITDMSHILSRTAINVAKTVGNFKIGVTGGVAYNELIMKILKTDIENSGFQFLQHEHVPCGDAGISIGQIAITASKFR